MYVYLSQICIKVYPKHLSLFIQVYSKHLSIFIYQGLSQIFIIFIKVYPKYLNIYQGLSQIFVEYLVSAVDEVLVEELLADPPHALHERRVQRLVVVLNGSEEGSYLRFIDLCITQL